MPPITVSGWVLIVCMTAYTLVAAVMDHRLRKIPNKLTIPVFLAGWIYQIVFSGPAGLLDGLMGFAAGFGLLFLMWIIGSSGGGDAKLIGGLSTWMGFWNTVQVLCVSTVFVLVATIVVVLWSLITRGVFGTKRAYVKTGEAPANGSKKSPRFSDRDQRGKRIMPYATAICFGTCVVMAWDVPAWPFKKARAEAPAQAAPAQPIHGEDAPDQPG